MASQTAPHRKSHPSLWAVGLFVVSSVFLAFTLALFASDFAPF